MRAARLDLRLEAIAGQPLVDLGPGQSVTLDRDPMEPRTLFAVRPATLTAASAVSVRSADTAIRLGVRFGNSAGYPITAYRTDAAGAANEIAITAVPSGAPTIVAVWWDGAGVYGRQQGTVSTTTSGLWAGGIGWIVPTSGETLRRLIYPGVLTADKRTAIIRALAHRYGI